MKLMELLESIVWQNYLNKLLVQALTYLNPSRLDKNAVLLNYTQDSAFERS